MTTQTFAELKTLLHERVANDLKNISIDMDDYDEFADSILTTDKAVVMSIASDLTIPDADVAYSYPQDMYSLCRRTIIHRLKEAVEEEI